jgi:hypothetical protein
MVVDNGDFDANNPEAGKEADRMFPLSFRCQINGEMLIDFCTGLLEEKGVKRTEEPAKETPEPAAADKKAASPETEETKKKSLKEKIKEKLYKY